MRKLPNAEQAWVSPTKITAYLLSEEHPEGSSKARFLRRFGFDRTRPKELERALIENAVQGEVVQRQVTQHGVKYEVVGSLRAPDGRRPRVVTVWIIEDDIPRFVSLNPSRRRIQNDS